MEQIETEPVDAPTIEDLLLQLACVKACVERVVNRLPLYEETNLKWLAVGTTDLQQGFMALERALQGPKGF